MGLTVIITIDSHEAQAIIAFVLLGLYCDALGSSAAPIPAKAQNGWVNPWPVAMAVLDIVLVVFDLVIFTCDIILKILGRRKGRKWQGECGGMGGSCDGK